MLTADTGSGEAKLQAEYILDGQNIKVGTGQAKSAGEAIAADLRKGKYRVTLTVADNNCNPWYIDAPSIGDPPEGLPWNPQVTAPLPLEALYFLMKEQVSENDLYSEYKNLIGGSARYSGSQVLATKNWFKSRPNGIDSTKVTDDVLAFCSIIITYAKSATKPLKPDESLKLRSTFQHTASVSPMSANVPRVINISLLYPCGAVGFGITGSYGIIGSCASQWVRRGETAVFWGVVSVIYSV